MKQNAKGNHDKYKIIILKAGLYCISLWILMCMLIVLKINIPEFSEKDILQFGKEFLCSNPFSFICFGIIILGGLGYIYFLDTLNDSKSLPVEIEECESVNYENLSFLATYIIPLVCFPVESKREIIVLFAVIAIIGCIFIKTNLYYTNPSLVLLGFNVYSVKCKNETGFGNGIVIVKGKLVKKDNIKYISLSDNVYFARRIK